MVKEPYRALFVGRVPRSNEDVDTPLIVERLREVGAGIAEKITIRNYSPDTVECLVAFIVESDFADIFEVKEARVQRLWDESRQHNSNSLVITRVWRDVLRGVIVRGSGADITDDGLNYRAVVPPHGQWSTLLSVGPTVNGGSTPAASFMRPAADEMSQSDRRRQEWAAVVGEWAPAGVNRSARFTDPARTAI